jgi:hypothetical protein
MAINFLGINPIHALVVTAILNGLLAPVILVLVMRVANDRAVMGERTNGRLLSSAAWATTLTMGVAATIRSGILPAPPAAPEVTQNKEHDEDDHDDGDDGFRTHGMYRLLLEAREGKPDRHRTRRLLTSRKGADQPDCNIRHEGHIDHRLAKHRRFRWGVWSTSAISRWPHCRLVDHEGVTP